MYKGPQSKTVEYDFKASGLCTRDVLLYSGPSSRRSHVIRNIRPSYENIKTQLSFNLTLGRVIHCTFAQGIMSDVIGFGLDRCGTWPVGIHGKKVSSAESILYQCRAFSPFTEAKDTGRHRLYES